MYILNNSLNFNPYPTFLGVTFAPLFLSNIMSYPCRKVLQPISCSPFYRLCFLGPIIGIFMYPIQSLHSPHSYLCFSRLVSFLPPAHITSVERMHSSFCRVITGCLSSNLIPLLHVKALLPPLRVTVTHQSLSFLNKLSDCLQPFC